MVEEESDEHVVVRALSFYPAFVYDETRICDRLCLFMKMGGFAFYTAGAIACVNRNDASFIPRAPFITYCFMLVGMFASICNLTRYEYAFYKKYGTMFNSIQEFSAWKIQQMPGLRYLFEVIERVIACCFFVTVWPLQFPVHDDHDAFSICELSMTVFKIQVITMFAVYSLVLFFFVCIYVGFRNFPTVHAEAHTRATSDTDAPMESFYFIDQQTECCICLDTNANLWTITRCAHSFHRGCLSIWTQTNATCPVCRTHLTQNQTQNQNQNQN
jgi:hypothetical protein